MPIFEYKCGRCGKETIIYGVGSNPPAARCAYCGNPEVKRLPSELFNDRFDEARARKKA